MIRLASLEALFFACDTAMSTSFPIMLRRRYISFLSVDFSFPKIGRGFVSELAHIFRSCEPIFFYAFGAEKFSFSVGSECEEKSLSTLALARIPTVRVPFRMVATYEICAIIGHSQIAGSFLLRLLNKR